MDSALCRALSRMLSRKTGLKPDEIGLAIIKRIFMILLLFIHLLAIGIWSGCVATEIVCELGQKKVAFKDSYIASLHWNIDKFVELPAIATAFITGALMLQYAPNDSRSL